MIYGVRRTIDRGDFVRVRAAVCGLLTGEGRLVRGPLNHAVFSGGTGIMRTR